MTDRLSITEGRKIVNAQANEATVQSAIVDYLTTQRLPFTRSDATQTFTHSGNQVTRVAEGWPDITICLPGGRFCGCEVKRVGGGVLSYEQAVTLDRIRRHDGLIVIARSVDDLIQVMIHGNRQADLDEIEKALAKGPDVKGLLRRRERNTRRRFEWRRRAA